MFRRLRKRDHQCQQTSTQGPVLDVPMTLSSVTWIEVPKNCQELPINSFEACKLETGETGFVAKAKIEGQMVTGYTTVSSSGKGYIPYGTGEHVVDSFAVLAADRNTLQWIRSSGHKIPKYAVQGGFDRGECQFIGRTCTPIQNAKTWQGDPLPAGNLEGEQRIGKIHRSHGCLYVPYNGKEYIFRQFEVLCHRISPGDLASICRWNMNKIFLKLGLDENAINKLPLPESLKIYLAST